MSHLMNETIPIQGRGNFPTLEVKLVGLVVLVKSKLEAAGIPVADIRLNGSVASSVLAVDPNLEYNDLDLIFSVELGSPRQYEKARGLYFTIFHPIRGGSKGRWGFFG